MINLPSLFRHWRVTVFSALLLLGLCSFAADTASLYSFIPLDSPGMASFDVPAVWNATADLRKNEMVSAGIQAFQEGLELSVEEDLLPWVGQTAVAVTDVRPQDPGIAVFMQIREPGKMITSPRLTTLLQTILQSGEQTKWIEQDIKGVPIRRTEIPQGKSVLKVATATLDGWLVITFGDGVIRKVIDARNGSIQSLESHPLYKRATGTLPAGALGELCLNGQGLLAQMQKYDPPSAARYEDSELGKFFVAGAVTYPNNNMQFDANYCTLSLTTQTMLKTISADAGAISGESLNQLPEGAFATLLINKPDVWLGAVEKMVLDSSSHDSRDMMEAGMTEFNTVRDVLKRFNGELAVGGAWRDGKGFGMTVAGQTGTDADAAATVEALNGIMEKIEMPIEKKDDLYTLPFTAGESEIFPTLVCWKANTQWLRGASHPDWLAPKNGQPALQMPENAKNANLALFGDYSFLPAFLRSVGAGEALPYLSMLKLDQGGWAYIMKIDNDGCAVHCQFSGGITTIGVAAAVLIPVFSHARGNARTTQSVSNLRQLALALQMYAQDNKNKLPVLKTPADMKKALGGYLGGSDQMFISPHTGEPYAPNPAISGKTLAAFANPESIIVFYEKTPGPDGSRCVAFMDGHVEVVQGANWDAVKKKGKLP